MEDLSRTEMMATGRMATAEHGDGRREVGNDVRHELGCLAGGRERR